MLTLITDRLPPPVHASTPDDSQAPAGALQSLNRGIGKQAQLKGDRMFAPVQPNESRILAVSLVKLSTWLNGLLGLDKPVGAKETPGQGVVKVGPPATVCCRTWMVPVHTWGLQEGR